jgi:four helix bundle protein
MIETGNVILDKSFNFALNIIAYCEVLDEKRKYIMANQLLRSDTFIGANVRESQNCESRADFIHKIK